MKIRYETIHKCVEGLMIGEQYGWGTFRTVTRKKDEDGYYYEIEIRKFQLFYLKEFKSEVDELTFYYPENR